MLRMLLAVPLLLIAPMAAAQETLQPVTPMPNATGEYAEVLDTLYEAGEWRALSTALLEPASQQEAMTSLDWLGAKYQTVGGAYIAHAYSNVLQLFAQQMPAAEAADTRGTALAAMAQAVLMARSDAYQCSDTTALGVKALELAEILAVSPLLDLPEQERRKAGFLVLSFEPRTWPARQQFDETGYLCTGGMSAMIAGMMSGTRRETQREGGIGRQIEVTPPADFSYGRRENSEWVQQAESVRAANEQMVLQLLNIDSVLTLEEIAEMMGEQVPDDK